MPGSDFGLCPYSDGHGGRGRGGDVTASGGRVKLSQPYPVTRLYPVTGAQIGCQREDRRGRRLTLTQE